MLLNLKLSNVFSIKEVEINFIKGRYVYKNEMVYNNTIVNPLALYGYNGSGKSSLFKAMAFLSSFFLEGDNYPLEINYLLEQEAKAKKEANYLISQFELTFKLANDIYNYHLSYGDYKVIKETLSKNNINLFERLDNKYMLHLYYDNLNEVKLKDKSLLIEIKDKFIDVYDYLTNINVILDNRINTVAKTLVNNNIYDLFIKYQAEIKAVFNDFLLFSDYEIVKKDYKYQMKYDAFYLPITYLSKGTFNIYLILSLLLASPKDSLLLIDDLDTNIHPFILDKIIALANEKQIQLIFSSHNTHLMQLFRPDQIYLASFNNYSSYYKRLSEYKENIREINNIEKMYLADVFKEV